jgi:hypothetical protein
MLMRPSLLRLLNYSELRRARPERTFSRSRDATPRDNADKRKKKGEDEILHGV